MNALLKITDYLGSLLCHGTIQAGHPVVESAQPDRLESFDMETLRIPQSARTFALRVRGNSMIDAGINDGDIVILEFKDPRNGDIVAALIDGESTLKRYVTKRGQPYLKAENAGFPVFIPAQDLVVQGVLVLVIRVVA